MITLDKSHSSFVTIAKKVSESIVISSYEQRWIYLYNGPIEIILDCRYVSVLIRNALCMVMYNYALSS